MVRKDWKFPYAAADLRDAARQKVEHCIARWSFWSEKEKETLARLKAEGINVDESLAAQFANKSYNRQPSVHIDPKLERDLIEANSKANEYHEKVKVYEGWVAVMEAQAQIKPEVVLPLDHEDWLFFFGK